MQNNSSIISKLSNYLAWTTERGLTSTVALREPRGEAREIPHYQALFVVDQENLTPEESTLLDRIVAAMKFADGDFKIIATKDIPANVELVDYFSADIFVAMGTQAGAALAGRPVFLDHDAGLIQQSAVTGVTFIVTLHPKEMLRHPPHKAQCWEHLKKALAYLSERKRATAVVQ